MANIHPVVDGLHRYEHIGGGHPEGVELCVDPTTRTLAVQRTHGVFGDEDWREVNVYPRLPKQKNLINVRDRHAEFPSRHDVTFVTEPFCTGGDLDDFLSEARRRKEQVPVDLVWEIIAQIIDGFQALWDVGLYHGDLHTKNIFLRLPESEESEEATGYPDAVIGDFGAQGKKVWWGVSSDLKTIFAMINAGVGNQHGERSKDLLAWITHFQALQVEAPYDPVTTPQFFSPQILARFYLQAFRHDMHEENGEMPAGLKQYFKRQRTIWANRLRQPLADIDAANPNAPGAGVQPSPATTDLEPPREKWEPLIETCEICFEAENDPQYMRIFGLSSNKDLLIAWHKLLWFCDRAIEVARAERDKFLVSRDNFNDLIQMVDIAWVLAKVGDQLVEGYQEEEMEVSQSALRAAEDALVDLNDSLLVHLARIDEGQQQGGVQA